MSTEFEALLDQRRELQERIQAAHDEAERRLIEAKAAYREDRNDETKAAKQQAVDEITEIRRLMRADRQQTAVGGDAYQVAETPDGWTAIDGDESQEG